MECQVDGLKGQFNKAVKFLSDELIKTTQALAKSLLFLSRNERTTVISGMQEGITKEALKELFKQLDEVELKAKDAIFSGALPVLPVERPKK